MLRGPADQSQQDALLRVLRLARRVGPLPDMEFHFVTAPSGECEGFCPREHPEWDSLKPWQRQQLPEEDKRNCALYHQGGKEVRGGVQVKGVFGVIKCPEPYCHLSVVVPSATFPDKEVLNGRADEVPFQE